MTNYLLLPVGEGCPDVVNAVIEIPSGQVNKYEYDKAKWTFDWAAACAAKDAYKASALSRQPQ